MTKDTNNGQHASWTKYATTAVTANTKKTHHAWSHLQWRAVYLFGSSLLSFPYKTFLRAPSAPPLAYHSWRPHLRTDTDSSWPPCATDYPLFPSPPRPACEALGARWASMAGQVVETSGCLTPPTASAPALTCHRRFQVTAAASPSQATRRWLCRTSTTGWLPTWKRCALWRLPTRSWSVKSASGTRSRPPLSGTTASMRKSSKTCAKRWAPPFSKCLSKENNFKTSKKWSRTLLSNH